MHVEADDVGPMEHPLVEELRTVCFHAWVAALMYVHRSPEFSFPQAAIGATKWQGDAPVRVLSAPQAEAVTPNPDSNSQTILFGAFGVWGWE